MHRPCTVRWRAALAAFQWFYNVRNQSIAHRYGPHKLAHTVVIIDEDTGKLLGHGATVYAMYQPSTDGTNALGTLIQVAIKHARSQVADLRVKCKAEMEAMHPSERRRLGVASYRIPDERSLRLGRRKYENINRQIRSNFNVPTHDAPKETRATIVKLNVPTRDGGHILAGMEVLGIREDDRTWCAISLELDLQGYGADPESACADLATSMEAQFEFAINDERGNFDQLFFATERQYFEMFNEYRRTATLVRFKKLAEELQHMSVTNTTDSDARLAIKVHALEESNAATDIVGSEHDDVTYSLLIDILTRHDSRFVMSVRHEIVNKNEAEKKELRHRMLHHPGIGGKRRHLRFDMMVMTN